MEKSHRSFFWFCFVFHHDSAFLQKGVFSQTAAATLLIKTIRSLPLSADEVQKKDRKFLAHRRWNDYLNVPLFALSNRTDGGSNKSWFILEHSATFLQKSQKNQQNPNWKVILSHFSRLEFLTLAAPFAAEESQNNRGIIVNSSTARRKIWVQLSCLHNSVSLKYSCLQGQSELLEPPVTMQ